MNHSVMSLPAPAWLRELSDARAAYQELLGWPVSVQVGRHQLVLAIGSALAAVTMPAALGERVRAQLGIAILSAPVVANSEEMRWTFLAKSDAPVGPAVVAELAEAGVIVVPEGSYVVVPTELEPASSGVTRWVEGPRPVHLLPPLHAVVAQTRRLTYGGLRLKQPA